MSKKNGKKRSKFTKVIITLLVVGFFISLGLLFIGLTNVDGSNGFAIIQNHGIKNIFRPDTGVDKVFKGKAGMLVLLQTGLVLNLVFAPFIAVVAIFFALKIVFKFGKIIFSIFTLIIVLLIVLVICLIFMI